MRILLVTGVGQEGLAAHLLEGWHGVEDCCVWSAAASARLFVALEDSWKAAAVDVRVTLVAAPTGGPYTGLRIVANDVVLHPIYAMLFDLQALDVVRIIEARD